MLGVNFENLASEIKRITGKDVVIPSAPFCNLYFVKTRRLDGSWPQVKVADHASSYREIKTIYSAGLVSEDGDNGNFFVEDGDLFFIKTRNTESHSIEIHRATASSKYRVISLRSPTAFPLTDAKNGTFMVDDSDVYFVKTKNCSSGRIEVYRASHKNYRGVDVREVTSLLQSESENGTWTIYAGNLYFIKYRNTTADRVEVQRLNAGDKYQSVTSHQTWFNISEGENGTWNIGQNEDLYFIKMNDTSVELGGPGRVQVHIATAKSNYMDAYQYSTRWQTVNVPDGAWCMR